MRYALCLLTLCLTTLAFGDESQRAQPTITLHTFKFNRTPFRQAIQAWSIQTNIPIVVNWNKLEEAAIEIDRPVSLILTDVRASTVLKVKKDSISGQADGS